MVLRFVLLVLVLLISACGDDQNPQEAEELWMRINAADGYLTFDRAPGFEMRVESRAAHGDAVVTYLNPVAAETIAMPGPIAEWPVGTLIVKEGFKNIDSEGPKLIAAMEKRADGWFWAEWNGDGKTLFSGAPELCTGCHRIGDDFTRAVFLP